MSITRTTLLTCALAFVVLALSPAGSSGQDKKNKDKAKKQEVWINPEDSTIPADFKIQGEYAGDKIGAQVIALGDGHFQVVVYPGGLPGDGWDAKNKILLDGTLDGEKVKLVPTKGKRSYKAHGFETFSATQKFPPVGQKDYNGTIEAGNLKLQTDDGKAMSLAKTTRKSKTLGMKPPEKATVLFDGTSLDNWQGGKLDKEKGLFNTGGNDVRSKKNFTNYTIHVEFMTPFKPHARDQERGNSGFYQLDHYEVQVLDSFGLDGKMNECGGIYKWRDSDLNMCYPPLTWQTYDVEFTNAVVKDGKKEKKARITVRLNGVVVHNDFELPGTNGGGRDDKFEGTPGPIKFQGHGNPVQYRNIWLVEK